MRLYINRHVASLHSFVQTLAKTTLTTALISIAILPLLNSLVQRALAAEAIPKSWVDDRVAKATARLSASEPGQLLLKSINAHGGLDNWYSSGDLEFRYAYTPLKGNVYDTFQTVDIWSAKARHRLTSDASIEFGWSGKDAWHTATSPEKLNLNARFWSLTPYYFVAMPFVLADEGVQLVFADDEAFEGNNYKALKATFGENVGDAPGDYYVILIHPETFQVGGLRYVVSYKGFFKDGGHSPEKFMSYDQPEKIGNVTLATKFRTFGTDLKTRKISSEVVTNAVMSNAAFVSRKPSSFFDPPAMAKVQEGM